MPLASLVLTSAFLLSCSASPSANNGTANAPENTNAANTAKDSVDELSMMIKLPFEPEEASWKDPQAGEKKLTAVLLYSAEDATKFASHLSAAGQPKENTINAEDWFPAELLSQSDIGGEGTLKGQSYPAGDIIQPPYTEGKVTRISDSNYFVVQLLTK